MRISERLASSEPAFSFEFFPPKSAAGEAQLFQTIDHLKPLKPAFVSVTYGAGGSTRAQTVAYVSHIKREIGIESMAHLTCVGADRDEIGSVLDQLKDAGIENVLPLRGDPPKGESEFVKPQNGFAHASELVHFIRQEGYDFCLAGAGYPEAHPESVDLATDITHLKHKVDCGLDFIITQLFYDNRDFARFTSVARDAGIDVPIIPGIMPITDYAQIDRIARLCGAKLPDALRSRLVEVRDDPAAVIAIGIAHATEQCRGLLEMGAPGIHFYTLNKSPATRAIVTDLEG